MSSRNAVSAPQSQIDVLQSRIRSLELENAALIHSKMRLISSTSSEMDRLRRYIHALTLCLDQSHDGDPGTVHYPIYEVEEKSVSPKQEAVTAGGDLDLSCPYCGGATNVSNNYYFQMVTTPNDTVDAVDDERGHEPGPGGSGSHDYGHNMHHTNMQSEIHVDPQLILEAKEYIPSDYPNDGHRDSHHLRVHHDHGHQLQESHHSMHEEEDDEKQVSLNIKEHLQHHSVHSVHSQRRFSGIHQHHQSNHDHTGNEVDEPNGYGSGDDDEDTDDFLSDEEQPLGGVVPTPGRDSVFSQASMLSAAFITPGNGDHLGVDHLNSNGQRASLGEHSLIPAPENVMDASFVICEDCTSNVPLQYIRPNVSNSNQGLQCTKCASFFDSLFLCNQCGKSVCEECYQYEAKMQSMDRVMTHFVPNEMDNDSDRLISKQNTVSMQCATTLHQLVAEQCTLLEINEFSLKLCHVICHFLYDTDLCWMLDVHHAADLLDIYWSLSPPKLTFQRKFGFSDVRLLHSLKWAENQKDWKVKQVVEEDIMIQNYLTRDYSLISFDQFMRKLSKDMNETTTYERILDLLQLIAKCSDAKHCEMLNYNQFAWRELGGPPIPCSKATLFVWNVSLLRRSYCFNVENRILDRPWQGK